MIEDDLRAAMRAHDPQAPTGFTPHAPRRRSPAPLAAAVLIVAIAATAYALRGGPPTRNEAVIQPVACPADYPGGVPARPIGVDARDSLAPHQTPVTVTMCAYVAPTARTLPKIEIVTTSPEPPLGRVVSVGKAQQFPRSGVRRLGGSDLGRVADTLSGLQQKTGPKACLFYWKTTDADHYLIELTYRTGRIWIDAPGNHCSGASNGVFSTNTNLLPWVSVAYRTGRWPNLPAPRATPSR